MEGRTAEKKRLLGNHALYGLDKTILEYLEPILEREVGVAFQNYCTKRKVLAAKEHSDAAHAVLVQNVMDLEGSVAPAWWREV